MLGVTEYPRTFNPIQHSLLSDGMLPDFQTCFFHGILLFEAYLDGGRNRPPVAALVHGHAIKVGHPGGGVIMFAQCTTRRYGAALISRVCWRGWYFLFLSLSIHFELDFYLAQWGGIFPYLPI